MYDFKKVEEGAKKVWKKYKKEIEKAIQNDPKKKLFSFLEGPPTANAPPALHHLEVRTFKDIICKFKYMQGFSVPRKGGWDCHGLPVEVQIEKKLGLNSKKDVIKYGVGKFINDARNSVFSYIKDWNKSTEELAYWVDLDNAYVTLKNEYIESVWWSLKELYNKRTRGEKSGSLALRYFIDHPPRPWHRVYDLNVKERVSLDYLKEEKIEYFVTSSGVYDLYITTKSQKGYPELVQSKMEFYDWLDKEGILIKTFFPTEENPGPEIRVYRMEVEED